MSGLFALEPHLDHLSNGLSFIGYVNGINFTADSRSTASSGAPSAAAGNAGADEDQPCDSQRDEGRHDRITRDAGFVAALRSHVDGVIGDAQSSWTPEEYMEENARQWEELNNHMLDITTRSHEYLPTRFVYPFANALRVLKLRL